MKVFSISDEDFILAESADEAIKYAVDVIGYDQDDFDDETYVPVELSASDEDMARKTVRIESDLDKPDRIITFAEHFKELMEKGADTTQLFASHNW